jgi:hypothetical protein
MMRSERQRSMFVGHLVRGQRSVVDHSTQCAPRGRAEFPDVRIARVVRLAAGLAVTASLGVAQSPPAPRSLGQVLSISHGPLASVSQVRALPHGEVIVNDDAGRRLLKFDSTFTEVTVIADSTGSTGTLYGSRIGGLIAYRGDSSLFVDPSSLSMLLIDPNGRVVRTLAIPRPSDANSLIGGPFGTPDLDARGRLIYRATIRPPGPPSGAGLPASLPDSSLIVRFDFANRVLDTVAKFGIPAMRYDFVTIQVRGQSVSGSVVVVNPLPWTDDWAVLADGTIAVVRGREYRVDLISSDDHVKLGTRLPFDWQRLTDQDKVKILDSTRVEMEKLQSAQVVARANRDSASGSSSVGNARPRPSPPPLHFVSIDELPDYRPAFRQGAARGDADGNLWIRTSSVVSGGPVYDIVNNDGRLVDRVVIPPGRVIAGFGAKGTVYMGVVDGSIVRLERARRPDPRP